MITEGNSMDDDEPSTVQLRFKEGDLVKPPSKGKTPDEDYAVDQIEPGDREGFVVEVKDGALDVNGPLREAVETHGRILDFGSRQHAEDYAQQLSASDRSLRIQDIPENEPKDIDTYLLADHNPSVTEPAAVDGETLTFDIGSNLYGALGEAIFLCAPKSHALVYFIRQDLDINEDDFEWGLNVDVEPGTLLSVEHPGGRKRWTPDCVVEVKDGWGGQILERYYCEIKTGDASFERAQSKAMEGLARDERVLMIRVGIEDLPEQYALRIHEVEPPE